jgi:predicted DsbA family dithiol-disulfide isomerase
MNTLTLHRFLVTAGLVVSFSLTSIAALGQDGERVLADVNGRQIKQRDVDALILPQVMPLEEQLYAIRQVALENLIVTAILEGEAKNQKISLDSLRRKLSAGSVEIAQSDVEKAYTENLSALASLSPDEARERLRLDLETQARMRFFSEAIARLRSKAQVRLFLEEPRLPDLAITSNAAVKGAPSSAVTIVEFGDFQCPYCRESQAVIKEVMKKFEGEVRLVFKHFPLDIHSQAEVAARAAFCAGEQNRFWNYHDALFLAADLSPKALNEIAISLQLDAVKFHECFDSDLARAAILVDRKDAARFGITSTPTFIVNGKLVRGAIDFGTFKTLIEREIGSARNRSGLSEPGVQVK